MRSLMVAFVAAGALAVGAPGSAEAQPWYDYGGRHAWQGDSPGSWYGRAYGSAWQYRPAWQRYSPAWSSYSSTPYYYGAPAYYSYAPAYYSYRPYSYYTYRPFASSPYRYYSYP
jgi:hypothetical protein